MLHTMIKFIPKVSGVAIVTRKGKVVGNIPKITPIKKKKTSSEESVESAGSVDVSINNNEDEED